MAYSGYDRMGRTSKAGRRAFGSSSTDLDALMGGRHWGNTQLTHSSQHQASIQARKQVCVCGLEGLRGVGGGVRAGVRGVEGDESVGRHNVDDKFGVKRQWTQKLWGFVRGAFGDG